MAYFKTEPISNRTTQLLNRTDNKPNQVDKKFFLTERKKTEPMVLVFNRTEKKNTFVL